jgi:hypothetical protein
MKKLLIISAVFFCCSFCTKESYYATTWAGTANNQLVTGAALRDGGTTTSVYTITTAIPSGLDNKIMTKTDLETYTDIITTNFPISDMTSRRCPTKGDILATL